MILDPTGKYPIRNMSVGETAGHFAEVLKAAPRDSRAWESISFVELQESNGFALTWEDVTVPFKNLLMRMCHARRECRPSSYSVIKILQALEKHLMNKGDNRLKKFVIPKSSDDLSAFDQYRNNNYELSTVKKRAERSASSGLDDRNAREDYIRFDRVGLDEGMLI